MFSFFFFFGFQQEATFSLTVFFRLGRLHEAEAFFVADFHSEKVRLR